MCCSICFNDNDNNGKKLPCGHGFHQNCIKEWSKIKNSCPNCRQYFDRSYVTGCIINTSSEHVKYNICILCDDNNSMHNSKTCLDCLFFLIDHCTHN